MAQIAPRPEGGPGTSYRTQAALQGSMAYVGSNEKVDIIDTATAKTVDTVRPQNRPLPSADGSCSSRELIVPGGAIFLMSDGVGNPLRWSTEVQETLAEWWRQPPDPFSFAAQVAFARRSHTDDRTVIGIWPDGADR